jgi:hypothetical protein
LVLNARKLSRSAIAVLRRGLDGAFSLRDLDGQQRRAFKKLCKSGWMLDGCAVGMLKPGNYAATRALLEAAGQVGPQ